MYSPRGGNLWVRGRVREKGGERQIRKKILQDGLTRASFHFYFFVSLSLFRGIIVDVSCMFAKPFHSAPLVTECFCLKGFPPPFFSHLLVMADPYCSIFIPCQLYVAANSHCWPPEGLDSNQSFWGEEIVWTSVQLASPLTLHVCCLMPSSPDLVGYQWELPRQ